MFGFGRKPAQPEAQIPYEVYETVHRPSPARQWAVRLVAALLAVTLVIVGCVWLSHRLLGGGPGGTSGQQGSGQSSGQGGSTSPGMPSGQDGPKPADNLNQSPQQNVSLPGSDSQAVTVPQSANKNDSTVRKPE